MGCWWNTHSAEIIYPHHYSRSRDMTQFGIFINHFLEPVLWNKGIHSCRLSVMNIFQPVSSWMAIIFQRETNPDIYMLQRQTAAELRCNQTHKCSNWRLEKRMSRHISHSRKHTPATRWDNSRYRLLIPGSNYHTGCNRYHDWEGWRESTRSFNFHCMISVSDSHELTSFSIVLYFYILPCQSVCCSEIGASVCRCFIHGKGDTTSLVQALGIPVFWNKYVGKLTCDEEKRIGGICVIIS